MDNNFKFDPAHHLKILYFARFDLRTSTTMCNTFLLMYLALNALESSDFMYSGLNTGLTAHIPVTAIA